MTTFNIEIITEQPDTAYVEIDKRYNVAIIRTDPSSAFSQLVLRVYPITKGEIWDAPFAVFAVDEGRITELENEVGEE